MRARFAPFTLSVGSSPTFLWSANPGYADPVRGGREVEFYDDVGGAVGLEDCRGLWARRLQGVAGDFDAVRRSRKVTLRIWGVNHLNFECEVGSHDRRHGVAATEGMHLGCRKSCSHGVVADSNLHRGLPPVRAS